MPEPDLLKTFEDLVVSQNKLADEIEALAVRDGVVAEMTPVVEQLRGQAIQAAQAAEWLRNNPA